MYTLGISCYYHDSAASLLMDGKVIAAVEEERFTRKKFDDDFPRMAIDWCLNEAGISPKNINQFVNYCINNLSLDVIGLMCLPPINENSEKYFVYLNQLKVQTDLFHLSMGMSNDYQVATKCGSTFLRIGSKILGERSTG